jgi:hypothetical protein
VALGLPTRAFAAALAGAAIAVTRFELDSPEIDLAEHFRFLSCLPTGTPITHHRNNSIRQGTFLGVEERNGRALIGIETIDKRKKLTSLLPLAMCGEIQTIAEPEKLSQTKHRLIRTPEFVAGALPGLNAAALSATTRIDCVLVGSVEPLRREIVSEPFSVETDSGLHEGNLQGILRAKRFASANAPYRSEVVPAAADSIPAAAFHATPHTVIFDGVPGFLNWRSRWPAANRIVLLDRSASSAGVGASEINYEYATRLGEASILGDLDFPPSIESVSYLEAVS